MRLRLQPSPAQRPAAVGYVAASLLAPLGVRLDQGRETAGALWYGRQPSPPAEPSLLIPGHPQAWAEPRAALEEVSQALEAGPVAIGPRSVRLAGDVLALAYHCLARPEEARDEGYDAWGRFRLQASLYPELGHDVRQPLLLPIVELLEESLRRLGLAVARPRYPGQRSFAVALTHDVDSLRKWSWRRALREVVESGAEVARAGPAAAVARVTEAVRGYRRSRATNGRDPHWSFPQLLEAEAVGAQGSTFFLKSAFHHPLDGRNGGGYLSQLPALVEELRSSPAEIGLHGSTLASERLDILVGEKQRLEEAIGRPVHGIRFHNLRFRSDATPRLLARAGLAYDATLGFAEAPGFRTGLPYPHLLYDLEADRPLPVMEIPLVLMDTTLIARRYLGLTLEGARRELFGILEEVRKARGSVSLLWHNDLVDEHSSRGLGVLYEEAVRWMVDHGGWATTAEELFRWWADRLLPQATDG